MPRQARLTGAATYAAGALLVIEGTREGRDAVLVTTPKDAVRLPSDFPARAVGVRLVWENAREIESILDQILAANAPDTGP